MLIGERLKKAFSAFMGRDPTPTYESLGPSTYEIPNLPMPNPRISKSIIVSIYNKIAVHVSSINIRHVQTDDDGNYVSTIYDSLNRVLSQEANLDQTARDMIREAVLTMLNEGCVAIVPVDTSADPKYTDSYKIYELRVGTIVQWFPYHVKVNILNPNLGRRVDMIFEKRICAIIENPFYTIMNEPNSTAVQLMKVLRAIDKRNTDRDNNKFNLIVQAPYSIRTDAQEKRHKARKKDIEDQLANSRYGIAYLDSTEHVIQLNRPLEDNLWTEARDLQADLFNQLGISVNVFNGTANEEEMINYYNRLIEPILNAIVENMQRKWISTNAQTRNQAIMYFRSPFKMASIGSLSDVFEKLVSKEILSKNECRSILGIKPSEDPRADMLLNPNINTREKSETNNIPDNIEEAE